MQKTIIILIFLTLIVQAEENKATFAGGCFWCMEAVFQPLNGVISVESGYMGGKKAKANYKSVSRGDSGHYEVVEIRYDSDKISYTKLLDTFWRNIDPLDNQGQFYDKGEQYQTVIFYHNTKQKELALSSKRNLNALKRFSGKIATKIKPSKEFFKAEDYHQDYFKRNTLQYQMYKKASGRDKYLRQLWK